MFKFLLATLFVEASVMILPIQARMNVLERDGRAVYIRRLGLNPPVLAELRSTCQDICDTLAINAANALLSVTGECVQQDIADGLIDVARAQKDTTVTEKLISLAIEYRETEKNTPADDTVSPPILRNSVYCQKAPKNPELKGLVQSQDPANDPNSFFDPAKPDKTIKLGEQPNTFHFDAPDDDSCDQPSDPANGDQNGGGDSGGGGNGDGAGGDDDNGAGGTGGDGDNGADGNDDGGTGGNDENTGGDDDCDDNGGENGDGQQSGDGQGDDDDCDDEPQAGPDSPDNGQDTSAGSGNAGGGYGGGNSGQNGGAPATSAEAPGGYRTGTAPASSPAEASASSTTDPKVTASSTLHTSPPKQTSPVASSSFKTTVATSLSSSATPFTPTATPTPAPTLSSTSSASPTSTASGDSALRLANGKAAQKKNAEFAKNPLKDGDPCIGSEVACLGNVDLGICTNGKLQTFPCGPSGGSCFAVPLKDKEGTSSTCITQSAALKLISDSGAGNSLTPV